MALNPSSPITGSAQTGFTSPTYTITSDTPPSVNAKQYAITAVGGTQTGVDVHSVSKPFTISFFRPQQLQTLPQANPTTGIIKNIPNNTYKCITRKGAQPSANQVGLVPRITTTFEIPAGCDTYEPEEIRAMVSAHFGFLYGNSAAIGDTLVNGLL